MRLQIKLQKKELVPARRQKSESLKKSLKLRPKNKFPVGVFFLVKLNQPDREIRHQSFKNSKNLA